METVIVFGSGGREYSIIKRLYDDSKKKNIDIKIICIQTNVNDKIREYASTIVTTLADDKILNNIIEGLLNSYNVFLGIVGGEDFLVKNVQQIFYAKNIPILGPSLYCSQLETSKFFCRSFIEKIPEIIGVNPQHSVFKNRTEFINNIHNITETYGDYVIKKDGLHRGKGVYVQGVDFDNTNESISQLNLDSSILLIEEKFVGEEYSLMSLVDYNNNIVHFPPIRDYKRLEDNDIGCNTGGMGCVIDSNNSLPFLNKEDIQFSKKINETILNNLEKSGNPYRGILYGSFMKTNNGIKVIEYNCRFGDPECIIALNLLQDNFYDVCKDYCSGTLKPLNFSQDACICVYIVPKSYCRSRELDDYYKYDLYLNESLNSNAANNSNQINITYSNIEVSGNHIYSLNSRCLAVTYSAQTLYNCYQSIYKLLNNIHGNIYYRTDIGKNFLSSYEASGVSISEASKSLNEIKSSILSTYNENVISEFGSFGGEYKLGEYVLVSSIDGVGTKTVLSKKLRGLDGFINLGRDIVGHSINDILVQGAEPLFFLDYYGCNNLKVDELRQFIKGVSLQCLEYGNIPILGGETAEMSKVYNSECVDLIGCIIGIKNNKFFKNNITSGDLIINLPSNGPHTNGFTLLNNIINENTPRDIVDTLLTPHKCYINEVKEFINLFGYDVLHGMCHITGGGLYENLERVVKSNSFKINIDYNRFPEWCKYVSKVGNVSNEEMLKVFNCGYGYILIVSKEIESKLNDFNYDYDIIGNIV